jgi:hypothetical protein
MRFGVRSAALAVALAVAAGCEPAYQLEVMNVQGPTVRVVVNGKELGVARCRDGVLVLRAGRNAPPLPWDIDLIRDDGTELAAEDIDGSLGPEQQLVILDVGTLMAPPNEPAAWRPFELLPCPAA